MWGRLDRATEPLDQAAHDCEPEAGADLAHAAVALVQHALFERDGQIQRTHRALSLHSGNLGPFFDGPDGRSRFDTATRELRDKDLLWTDYAVGAVSGGDLWHDSHLLAPAAGHSRAA